MNQNHNLTVGQLLEFIEEHNIPMDSKVRYERIQDSYFKSGSGWTENSIFKPDFYGSEDQFIATFSPIKYPDDDNLYLTAHY